MIKLQAVGGSGGWERNCLAGSWLRHMEKQAGKHLVLCSAESWLYSSPIPGRISSYIFRILKSWEEVQKQENCAFPSCSFSLCCFCDRCIKLASFSYLWILYLWNMPKLASITFYFSPTSYWVGTPCGMNQIFACSWKSLCSALKWLSLCFFTRALFHWLLR